MTTNIWHRSSPLVDVLLRTLREEAFTLSIIVSLTDIAAGLSPNKKYPQSNTMKLKAVTDDFAAYIGMDWADRKHDISLYDRQTQSWSQETIQSSPEAIADWVNQLRKR
jgi:hypothetical protein